METLDAIRTRRSIRKFTPETVSDDHLDALLEAAMCAPSAGNQRPWQFVVVRDAQLREEIPNAHPYAQMAAHAPVVVVVCGDLNQERHKGFWIQDCAAATQNLLLAARALGLGAVWCGVYPREDRVRALQSLLRLPKSVIPLSLVPIGHPDEDKPFEDRFDRSRVHVEHW
jgi:nitroreductase